MNALALQSLELLPAEASDFNASSIPADDLARFIDKQVHKLFFNMGEVELAGTWRSGHLVRVITYCCAVKVQSWDEIEQRLQWYAVLICLAGDVVIHPVGINRCLVHYRESLKQTLAHTLEYLWREEFKTDTCFTVRHSAAVGWAQEYKRCARTRFMEVAAAAISTLTISIHKELPLVA